MTWLYCGAFYGQLYMVSNAYQRGAIDVIGGTCRAVVLIKLSGLASERLPTVTRLLTWIGRNTPLLFCMHLVVLNAAPWSALFAWRDAHSIAAWPIMLAAHVVCSGVLTGTLYVLPVQRRFFAERGSVDAGLYRRLGPAGASNLKG